MHPTPRDPRRARRALLPVLLCAALLHAPAARADDMQIAGGLFFLADQGTDLQLSYRRAESHIQFGLRYLAWADVFVDPYAGHPVDETRYRMVGPVVNYLFTPEADHTWYLGAELLETTQTITPVLVGAPTTPGSTTSTDPYFGGGYLKRLGPHFFYNLGLYLSPTFHQQNRSAVSSTSQNGNADVQVQIGATF